MPRAKSRRDHTPGKLLETLPENPLGAIAGDDAGIVGDAGERSRNRALGDALRGGFLLDAVEPGGEIAAARRSGRPAP